jgi:hypothetical protein
MEKSNGTPAPFSTWEKFLISIGAPVCVYDESLDAEREQVVECAGDEQLAGDRDKWLWPPVRERAETCAEPGAEDECGANHRDSYDSRGTVHESKILQSLVETGRCDSRWKATHTQTHPF